MSLDRIADRAQTVITNDDECGSTEETSNYEARKPNFL